jgi:uncharacterized repeat protein (TIGR03803 family)
MKSVFHCSCATLVLCAALLSVPTAQAQSWGQTTLYQFQGGISGPDAGTPYGGVIKGTDGNYYGTTWYGGSGSGAVFKVTPGGVESVVYSFSGTDGQMPFALVQGANGNLYGGTWYGGQGYGVIYEVTTSGQLTVLQSFSNTNGSPAYIQGGLILGSDGNFYGTSAGGGTYGQGSLFKMTPDGELTVLYSFTGSSGTNPHGELLEAKAGEFLGSTAFGGDGANGTVYKFSAAKGKLTVLHAFSGGSDGALPWSNLVKGSDGAFYGTTQGGGTGTCSDFTIPAGCGTVFRVTASGEESIAYTFAGYPTDGAYPTGGLTRGKEGILYGTTAAGGFLAPGNCGSGCGTIFSLSLTGTRMILFACGEPPDPWYYDCWGPSGALLLADNVLTGTSSNGGNGWGNLFQIAPAPTVTLTANPSSITLHDKTLLQWSSTDAQSCVASGNWTGDEPTKGKTREQPFGTGAYTYTLTCTGVGGSASASATVMVNAN